jgi:hypothetical protein
LERRPARTLCERRAKDGREKGLGRSALAEVQDENAVALPEARPTGHSMIDVPRFDGSSGLIRDATAARSAADVNADSSLPKAASGQGAA